MSELLLKLATKIYNKSEDELKPMIFDEEGKELDTAFENLLSLDTARVKRFRDKETEQFNAGHKKAKSEVAGEIENYFKTEFGIDVDGNYEAIAGTLKEQLASSKAKGKEITPDDIKKHPFFLDYEKTVIPKQKYEQVAQEYEGFKTKVERDKKFSILDTYAEKQLEKFKPDFKYYEDAPQIKQKLIEDYKNDLKNSIDDFEVDENGMPIVLIKDGKRLEDQHMNPIKPEDLAKQKAANYFKFLVQEPKSGAGNGRQTTTTGGNGSFFTGKTRSEAYEEYIKIRSTGKETQETLAKMNAEIMSMQS